MISRLITHLRYLVLTAGVVLGLIGLAYAATGGDIHPVDKYAWSTNAGWINFNPTHGGVTIDPATGSFDGYAWGENVGWIHFKRPDVYNVVVVEGGGDIYLPIILKSFP